MPAILFVCTGNICRSPIAEGLLRARRHGAAPGRWRIDSAGIHARDGSAPEPLAVEVAAELGADIATQRSRVFVREDFDRFELIVAMDHGHRDYLGAVMPANFRGRVTMLKSGDGRLIEVPDPYGRSRRVYVKAAALIAEGIAGLFAGRELEG